MTPASRATRALDPRIDPDAAAVRAAQRDRRAFEVLYRRYVDRVYAHAFYALGDHHDAEDATERTFLDAMKGIGGYRDTGAGFRAWLFRVAHNTVSNAMRSRRRRRTEPIPDGWDRPAPNADPAALVARAEEGRRVLRAVRDLPLDRRQVVLLRFVDGLSAAEIGIVLDRSPGAVRVLLHRALRDLATRLEG
ncbi:MAG: sigma-70 family RNA polymerase sigma factor [Chloroflexota bacterium]